MAKPGSGKRIHKHQLGLGRDRTPRADTPPQGKHGLGVGTDPGSDRRAHGATRANIRAQVDVRSLEVHNTLGTRNSNHRTVLKVQVALGGPRQRAADFNQSGGLAAVPVDNHTTTHQHIGNNGTSAENR